jgi:beta-exotoxin I transport system permease protein
MRLLASELRLRWVSLVGWAASIAALMVLILAVYPSIKDNDSLNSIYANLDPATQALLGGSDLTSPVGYLNTQVFAFFLPAVLLVFAVARGTAALAGEEQDRTLDLLLAQPVPRWAAYSDKSLALLVGVGVLTLASLVPLLVMNGPVGLDLPAADLVAVCLQMGLFALGLGLAAQAISAATGRRGVGTAVVAGYAFVSYFVYGLSATVTWLEHLKPLTLWRWYLANDPLSNGLGWNEVLVLSAVCVVAVVAGALAFQRRDLRA